jgi:hypothetical protein
MTTWRRQLRVAAESPSGQRTTSGLEGRDWPETVPTARTSYWASEELLGQRRATR